MAAARPGRGLTVAARSEEDVVAGVLRIAIGGTVKPVPVLRIKAAREWKATLATTLTKEIGELDVDSLETLGAVGNLAGDRLLDLVVAYDTSAALGGRDWIEEHADDAQVYAAFRAMLDVSFPFVGDLRGAMAEFRGLLTQASANLAAASAPARSPSTPSPNGVSTLKRVPSG